MKPIIGKLTDTLHTKHGDLQLLITERDKVVVSGTLFGAAVRNKCDGDGYDVERQFGGKWRPGWLNRLHPEGQPSKRVTKIVLEAVEKWAEDRNNRYMLDLVGEGKFRTDVRQFVEHTVNMRDHLTESIEDNFELFIDSYGDWIAELDDGKTVKRLQDAMEQLGDLRCTITDLVTNELPRLLKAVEKHFPLMSSPSENEPCRVSGLPKVKATAKASKAVTIAA
jgi:hypothetical protein